jgi:hypothetical protein
MTEVSRSILADCRLLVEKTENYPGLKENRKGEILN